MKKVDIIIPVHNRLEHTIQTLDSLILNTDSELFNLYVVDDKSNDHVYQELEMYKRRAPIPFYLSHNFENIGPGASRNAICNMIKEDRNRSKYLYHSDNDVYFKTGWLERLIQVYEYAENCQFKIKVLGASCHPYLQSSERLPIPLGYIGLKDAVSGYSQFMTWETWEKYGPFDETMRGQEKKIMGSEDWAFCQKIVRDGYRVGSIEPEIIVPCGKTNTYGEKATGHETFKEVAGVKIM